MHIRADCINNFNSEINSVGIKSQYLGQNNLYFCSTSNTHSIVGNKGTDAKRKGYLHSHELSAGAIHFLHCLALSESRSVSSSVSTCESFSSCPSSSSSSSSSSSDADDNSEIAKVYSDCSDVRSVSICTD